MVALIEASGLTWGESNTLLITTKCLFTHACGKRLINVNPCHGIMLSALLGERPPKRQRLMLTRDEIKLLLGAGLQRRNALAIRILLATAVRSAELYQAKWVDVDLDGAQWHVPKSKTGAAMDIPLAPVVVDWFRELRPLAGESAYVLPAHSRSRAARHGGDTHLNKDTLREAIDHWLRTEQPVAAAGRVTRLGSIGAGGVFSVKESASGRNSASTDQCPGTKKNARPKIRYTASSSTPRSQSERPSPATCPVISTDSNTANTRPPENHQIHRPATPPTGWRSPARARRTARPERSTRWRCRATGPYGSSLPR